MEKIGLYVGKFDPMHIGDINILQYAKNFCDRIWIVPVTLYKTDIPYEDRIELCTRLKNIYFRKEVSVKKYPFWENDLGYRGALELIYRLFPDEDFYYIVNSESYERIKTYEHPELQWIYKHAKFVVIGNHVEGDYIAYQEEPRYDLSWVTSDMVKDHLTYNTAVPFITHAMYKYFWDNKLVPNIFKERLL